MAEQNISEVLRAAAAKLRASLPHCLAAATTRLIQSDSEAIDAVAWCEKPDHEPYTECDHCHVVETHHLELAVLVVALYQAREPLAAWLERAAAQWADDTYLDKPEHTDGCGPGWSMCKGHAQERFCDRCGNPLATGAHSDRCTCWDAALAVARALNGTLAAAETGGAR